MRKGPSAGPGGARVSFGSPARAGGRARGRRARVPAASVGSFGSHVAESVEHRSNAGPGKILEGPKPLPCQSPFAPPVPVPRRVQSPTTRPSLHLPLLILYKATLVSRASPPQTYKNPSGSCGFPPRFPPASPRLPPLPPGLPHSFCHSFEFPRPPSRTSLSVWTCPLL